MGDNTDVPGLLAALDDLEAPPGGWLVLGTGGGARAAVGAALRARRTGGSRLAAPPIAVVGSRSGRLRRASRPAEHAGAPS